jgi:hypothetical protein
LLIASINTGANLPTTFIIRVEDDLAKLIDEISKEEGINRSSVIRRFITKEAKDWMIRKSLQKYADGKITLWQAARKCGLSLWELTYEAKKREAHVPYTIAEFKEDLKGLQKAY